MCPQYENDFGMTLKLPTKAEVEPGARQLGGCYVSEDTGEATFVPPRWFLQQPPLWRIDVLQDLMRDFELVRRHAMVEWAHSLSRTSPDADEATRLSAFRQACDQLGVHIPDNLEALLVLSDRFKAEPGSG